VGEAAAPTGTSEHGLKANAIGFMQAPAVLLASFVPMFFIAAAFYYMNRADEDCGTTFS
jgi:hypothetical protein